MSDRERILRHRTVPYVFTANAVDSAGEAAAISEPVTVEILDGAGAVVDSGTPTIEAGALSYSVPAADLPYLDRYTAVFTGVVEGEAQEWEIPVEVVGGFVFDISELLEVAADTDVAELTTDRLEFFRQVAEDEFELGAMVAFVPRACREQIVATGGASIFLKNVEIRAIYGMSVDGVALTETELAALTVRPSGVVSRSEGFSGIVDVHYEHGYPYPPAPVVKNVITLAIERASDSNLPSRATSESTDVGVFRISTAGPNRQTGIPDVDRAMEDFGRKRPMVV